MSASSRCPKCGGFVIGDVDLGRQESAGAGAKCLITQSIKCVNCGYRTYPEIVPHMVADKQALAPNRLQKYVGGRKAGYDVSPASVVAVQFFDLIVKMRRKQLGWIPITRHLVELSGQKFCDRSLQRYYEAEVHRRDDARRVVAREARRAKKVGQVADAESDAGVIDEYKSGWRAEVGSWETAVVWVAAGGVAGAGGCFCCG